MSQRGGAGASGLQHVGAGAKVGEPEQIVAEKKDSGISRRFPEIPLFFNTRGTSYLLRKENLDEKKPENFTFESIKFKLLLVKNEQYGERISFYMEKLGFSSYYK